MSGAGVKRRLEKMEGPGEGTLQNLKRVGELRIMGTGCRHPDHRPASGRPERSPASNKYRGQRGKRAASRRKKKRWRRWKWDRQPDRQIVRRAPLVNSDELHW